MQMLSLAEWLASLVRLTVLSLVLPFAVRGESTPWGRDYFPNVPLTDQDGREVRFFDDLIEGKIVVINFIYTGCPDTCPLETAQLVKVQELLEDRLEKDVFFYSITLDPERDTPDVLKAYREMFGARWTFLTGDVEAIWKLQKKLGLFLEEIREGLNKHNVNMIIGNQRTGRWMKRSPHENPYVLADQIGTWLDGWKRPSKLNTYGAEPKLRQVSRGEQLFRTRCAVCHSLQGADPENALGPDLLGVTQRRERKWLLEWLRAPDFMLARKDPIAMALFEQYKRLPMPNLRLKRQEVVDVLDYLNKETERLRPANAAGGGESEAASLPKEKVVTVMRAELRPAHVAAKAQLAFLHLKNPASHSVRLTGISSPFFGAIEMRGFRRVNGRMQRENLEELVIPAGGEARMSAGGIQLVCRERRRPTRTGDSVPLALQFDGEVCQEVIATVVRRIGALSR